MTELARSARLAAAMLLAVSLLVPPAAASMAPELIRLSNGLEVLLRPEDHHEAVAVQVWYRIGPRYETAETLGFSHLFEHLMATGTPTHPPAAIAASDLSARASSISWSDVTVFFLEGPTSALDQMLAIEADRMRNLELTDALLDRAAQDIQNEITQMIVGNPATFIEGRARALAFAGHPYGHWSKASPDLAGEDRVDRCRAFYERYFAPGNACLTIVGGFDREQALQLIETHFGALTGGEPATARMPELPAPAARSEALELGMPEASVTLAYPVPGEASGKADALRVLVAYLNGPGRGALTAPLANAERGAPAEPTATLEMGRDAGLLLVSTPVADPATTGATREVLAARLAETPAAIQAMTASQLDGIRDFETFSAALARRTVTGRASALAAAYLLANDLSSFDHGEAGVQVDRQQLVDAAKLLDPTRAVTVALDGEI